MTFQKNSCLVESFFNTEKPLLNVEKLLFKLIIVIFKHNYFLVSNEKVLLIEWIRIPKRD